MKKIGTLTSAAGLIFFGIWLMINNTNPELARNVFKFWPCIFVVLGAEIVWTISRKRENMNIKINYLVIPVIIVFLIANVIIFTNNKVSSKIVSGELDKESEDNITQSVNVDSDKSIEDGITESVNISLGEILEIGVNGSNDSIKINTSLDKLIENSITESIDSISINNDTNNYKIIKADKILEKNGDEFKIDVINGDITFEKSDNEKINIDAQVYVKKSWDKDDYEVQANKILEGYEIDFKQDYVKKIKATIYIPSGYSIVIDGTNVNIKCDDKKLKSDFYIDGTNGNIDLEGDIEIAHINMTNGNVEIGNKICKDIQIDLTNGNVEIDTEDNNIDIDVDTVAGICNLNGSRSRKLNEKIGKGEGKVFVDITSGLVEIDTQE